MIDVLLGVLAALGLVAVAANAASILQGIRLREDVRKALRLAFGGFRPRVVVVLPLRGLDEGFDENLRAILGQKYPGYRLLAVSDDASDPSLERLRAAARATPGISADVVLSDPEGMGGKVNALRTALGRLRPDDEVVVFADADIRPASDWLHHLVQPLADASVGVSTGFRWYVPPRPAFWSLVRSEWNAVSANVLFDPRRAFVWGGSCAVRVEDLPRLGLRDRWQGVLSDDLVLARAAREAGLGIAYAPGALVATFEGADRATCREWCERQILMATLYHPVVRRYAAMAFAVSGGAVLLGAMSLLLALLLTPLFLVPAGLFLATLAATVAKASLRRQALFLGAPHVAAAWHVPAWRSALAGLAVPWTMIAGLARTRRARIVRWRGRAYDVSDPQRVRLVSPDDPASR